MDTDATRRPPEAPQPPEQEGIVETRYLDLDGDGVPDAVQVVEAIAVDDGDADAPVVEVVEEIQTGIGIDGVPEQVAVVDDAVVELDPVDDDEAD